MYKRTRQGRQAIYFSWKFSVLFFGCVFVLCSLTGACFAGQALVTFPARVPPHPDAERRDYWFQPGLFAIRTYQRFISPLLGPRCNFRPSCSRYAAEAIRTYGIVKGTIMAADRLTRCHYCAGLYYQRSKGLLEDPVADNLLTENRK